MNHDLFSPELAWKSDIFRTYVAILIGVMGLAGAVLAGLTFVLKKNVSSIWTIYRSWLVMAPLAFLMIALGRGPTVLFFTALSLIGAREFIRATGLATDRLMSAAVYAAIAGVGVTTLIDNPNTGNPGWYGLFMAMPVYAIAAFILVPIIRNRTQGQLQATSLAILGFIYIGWMFLHAALLTNVPQAYGYLLYLLFAVELNDISAFTFGKLFGRGGKHPFRSNISPKKTWEGAIGAFAVSMALPWAMQFSFPHFGMTELILTGLIVGVGGQLGDLSISIIKRDTGIKAMGTLIPGHGGILDRIDSLIYTAPLFMHMVDYFHKQW